MDLTTLMSRPAPVYEKVPEGIRGTSKTYVDLVVGFLPEQVALDFAIDGFSTAPIPNKIVISHVAASVTVAEIRAIFENYGVIQDIRLVKNIVTGEAKGYGFIEFLEDSAAAQSLEVHGRRLHGKDLKVMPARPHVEDARRANLHIRGLHPSWTVHELYSFFKYQGQVVETKILLDEQTGVGKGVGFVRFATRLQADFVRQTWNGKVPAGESQPIQVSFTHAGRIQSANNSPSSSNPASPLPVVEQQFGFSAAVTPEIGQDSIAIFVGNLDDSTTPAVLRTEFGKYGVVTSVRIMKLGSVSQPGFGFVNMENATGAVNAVRKLHRFIQPSGMKWLVQLKTDNQ